MRLCFFVQMIDPEDTIRGFIPGWISALAGEVDELVVISQENRIKDFEFLGPNVRVHSLGKEAGKSKWQQFLTLKKILNDESFACDALLTHMNPTYTIAAAAAAKKKLPLFTWYAHKTVSMRLKWANTLSTRCFSASLESFRLPTDKIFILGLGIDLKHFSNDSGLLKNREKALRFNSACRLSPVKRVELLLASLENLPGDWGCDIAGEAGKNDQKEYASQIKISAEKMADSINFQGAVPYSKMPEFLKASDIHVNLSSTGSLDKGLLEAVASGLTVLTSNEAFKEFLKGTEERTYIENPNVESLKQRLSDLLNIPREQLQKDQELLYERLCQEHSLKGLSQKLVAQIKEALN
jgi:glycosyltransferase involved in cell wall biosynthesis